jgi:lambda repressor-like predicted transcriptional regulator
MGLEEVFRLECQKVSQQYVVPMDQILDARKPRRSAAARVLIAKAMRVHSPNSLTAIGRLMNVNHTTVIRMLRKDASKARVILMECLSEQQKELAQALADNWNQTIAEQMTVAEREIWANRQKNDPESDCGDSMQDAYRRRFEVAVVVARQAPEDKKDATFRSLIKDIFPATAATPSALIRMEA